MKLYFYADPIQDAELIAHLSTLAGQNAKSDYIRQAVLEKMARGDQATGAASSLLDQIRQALRDELALARLAIVGNAPIDDVEAKRRDEAQQKTRQLFNSWSDDDDDAR